MSEQEVIVGVRVAIETETGRILFLLKQANGGDVMFALNRDAALKMALDINRLSIRWQGDPDAGE